MGTIFLVITDTESTDVLFEKKHKNNNNIHSQLMCDLKNKLNIAVLVTVCIATKPFVAKATRSFFAKRVPFLYAI